MKNTKKHIFSVILTISAAAVTICYEKVSQLGRFYDASKLCSAY